MISWRFGFDFSEFGFYILLCGGVLMSLCVNIQRLPESPGKSDAILGKEIKREEGKLVAGGGFSLYYHSLNKEYFHYTITRSLGALRVPTSSWRPFGVLDFVLRALRALRPCDPRVSDWTVCNPLDSVLAVG